MNVHGRVVETIPKERVVKLLSSDSIIYLYLQRKDFKEYGPYFFDKPYIFAEVSDERKVIGGVMTREVIRFRRIVQPSYYSFKTQRKIYYDIEAIKKGVKALINKPHNKLFIDLEFTMPAYYQTMPHIQEIIQYGIVVEDKSGNIVFEDSSLVRPKKTYNLNGRTLKFLSRKRGDFDIACSYKEFYDVLKMCIKKYNPKIYAWGRSDVLAIEQSFSINKMPPIDVKSRHINLMHVIKNYYNLKDEIGLFQTYEEMAEMNLAPQQHDALEDAMITREIFRMFKDKINQE